MSSSIQLINTSKEIYENGDIIFFYLNLKTKDFINFPKSLSGKVLFIFIKPILFLSFFYKIAFIKGIFLFWKNKKIINRNIKIFFKDGKPYLIKLFLIFQNFDNYFNYFRISPLFYKTNKFYFLKSKELTI